MSTLFCQIAQMLVTSRGQGGMNSYREHPGEFDAPAGEAEAPDFAVADAIRTDERRMHVRAYNHWCSLLEGRDFPSIEDLEPGDIHDFGPHSVLLDFTEGHDNPAMPYIGAAIRAECDLAVESIYGIDEDPGRLPAIFDALGGQCWRSPSRPPPAVRVTRNCSSSCTAPVADQPQQAAPRYGTGTKNRTA